MNWVTLINTAVGIIGIIVGIIGWKSLSAATKIKNSIKTGDASNIQQAQVIHNGLDDYAVIRLSRETTQEELKKAKVTTQLGTGWVPLLEQIPDAQKGANYETTAEVFMALNNGTADVAVIDVPTAASALSTLLTAKTARAHAFNKFLYISKPLQ